MAILLLFLLEFSHKCIGKINYEVFPNGAGVSNVDLYLSFAFPNSIPPNSIISIKPGFSSWNHNVGHINDYCWSNINYLSCIKTNDGNIAITTSAKIISGTKIEIYLDDCLNLPWSPGDYPGFSIISSWNGVIITYDDSSTNIFTVLPNSLGVFRSLTIGTKFHNTGESSDFVYALASNIKVYPGYQLWIKFDRAFNPWIAEAKELDIIPKNSQNSHYIGCSSKNLGNITCTANHWWLMAKNIENFIDSGAWLNITIKNVIVPYLPGTYNFRFWTYILDNNTYLQAHSNIGVNAKLVYSQNIIELKSIIVSDNHLLSISDYEFQFFVGEISVPEKREILFSFPWQFNLAKNNATLTCFSSYFDELEDPLYEIPWITLAESSCLYYNNYIRFMIPEGLGKTFSRWHRIKVVIKGVINPQWGFKTSPGYWDSDKTSYYSDKFEIGILNSSGIGFLAKTYGLVHNGYVSFIKSNQTFEFIGKFKYCP
ncbi:unnamed protein product [Blepharisma stoltei]|uniref:Uncharacterized protein n=1 Tax=Blepharisma stoltei TaxID=1481888 RepID=A0AAU9JFH7_9CILI|nr:unnamed protein product [Blepharisma stoltei]